MEESRKYTINNKWLYYIFFIDAFFNPYFFSGNIYPADIFPLLFFGMRLTKNNFKWILIVILFFLFRSLLQILFFAYVSPDIIKDSIFFIIFISSCFIFNSLFFEEDQLKHFTIAALRLSWLLILAIVVSYFLPNSMLSYFEGGKRLSWEPFNEGGPRFSAVFTLLGLLQLYAFNHRFPKAKFIKRLIELVKVIPFLILCLMGGTRVFLFAFLFGIILHFRISLLWTFISISIFFFLPLETIFGSLSRNSADGARGIIWANFYSAIIETNTTFWWGYGPGGINLQIVGAGEEAFFRLTHNLFLQIWFELGLPAMIVGILYYFYFGFKVFRFKQPNPIIYAIFTFVILAELFDGSFSFIGCQWVFAASYALIFLSIRQMKEKKHSLFESRNISRNLISNV